MLSTSSSRFHQQPVHPGVNPPRLRSRRCYSSKRLFPWLASAVGNALQKILKPGLIGLKTMLQLSMSWMENFGNHNTSIKYEATIAQNMANTQMLHETFQMVWRQKTCICMCDTYRIICNHTVACASRRLLTVLASFRWIGHLCRKESRENWCTVLQFAQQILPNLRQVTWQSGSKSESSGYFLKIVECFHVRATHSS